VGCVQAGKLPVLIMSNSIWSCDFGGGVFHVVQNGDIVKYQQISIADFIALVFAQSGDIVLVENAHIQARNEEMRSSISLAQGLTYADQLVLERSIEAKQITFRLVPHSLTPKLRSEYFPDSDKGDAVDAAVIAKHAEIYGCETLQRFKPKPPGEWTPAQLFAFEAKREMDLLLNYYRAFSDPAKLAEVPCFDVMMRCAAKAHRDRWTACLFQDAKSQQEIIDMERWIFSISATRKKSTLDVANNSVLASLWVALFDLDGNPRILPTTGKGVGINFAWKELLFNKPNHFRGGIARSNVWHWGFKYRVLPMSYKKGGMVVGLSRTDNPKRNELLLLRRRYAKVCKTVMRMLRAAHQGLDC